MTKKDYITIAAALKDACPRYNCGAEIEQWVKDCRSIANALQNSNPRFKTDTFLLACGINP